MQKDLHQNHLMAGLNEAKANTPAAKQVQGYKGEFKQVISTVTAKFTELLKQNRMLGVEILFRFPSREIKDQILNNYEHGARQMAQGVRELGHEAVSIEDAIDMNNFA